MKKLLIVLLALPLVACGKLDQLASHYTGQPSEVCVSGVVYLQFTSGATVKVNREGKPVSC